MKLLHICCNLAGSTVFPQLFENLREAGADQVVFVPEKYASNIGKNMPAGVETHYALTVKKTDALFFFRKAQRSVPKIQKTIDMQGVTLIHAHTLFTDGSIARALSRKTGVPYVVTLRYSDIEAIWKYEPHLRPMGRAILRDAKRVVFLGDAAKEKVLGTWFSKKDRAELEKKASVIPNGIRAEWLDGTPRKAPEDPVRVGFVGLLNDRKQPHFALEATHLAGNNAGRRFVFRAAGAGPMEERLRQGLWEGDALVGRLEGIEAMKRFYAQCDVLLVPSKAETFGMVYLEAMSQGVPVLYSSGQGFDGQFPAGEVGYAVTNDDPADQAKKLGLLLDDYEARSARCVEGAKKYEWTRVAGKWMTLYSEID